MYFCTVGMALVIGTLWGGGLHDECRPEAARAAKAPRVGPSVETVNAPEALAVAQELGAANPGGAYEIRPVGQLWPGSPGQAAS